MTFGTFAGYVLVTCFVACVAVVLSAIADVSREREQGTTPAVSVSYARTPLPAYYSGRNAVARDYVGRHRR
jgi:hypothetical protein